MSKEIIFRGPSISCPPLEKSLGHCILEKLLVNPEGVFQYDPYSDTSYTRGEIRTLSIRVALALQQLGLKQGDIITLVVKNHKNTVLPLLGALYLGVTISLLDETLNNFELKRMLESTKPKMVLCDTSAEEKFRMILNEINLNIPIYLCDKDFEDNFMKPFDRENQFEPVEVDVYKTYAFIFCSSGTTGFLKGVTHTHYSFYNAAYNSAYTVKTGDIALSTSTLVWTLEMRIVLHCLLFESIRVSINWHMVTPKEMLDTIEKYNINCIISTPAELVRMINYENFDQYAAALSKLRVIQACGARCTKEQLTLARQKIPNAHIINGFGFTEIGMLMAFFDSDTQYDLNIKKVNSNGVLSPGIMAKVIDVNTGKSLGKNQQGELYLKCESLTAGYYNNAEANKITFTEDGWFRTGDCVYFDDDECVFASGRLKEIFKYDTFYVCPSEVEYVINKHPAVSKSCVLGIPDEINGDIPMAFVVKKENVDVTEEEIIKFVEKHVSYYERLRGGVRFVDEFPRTPSGKIRKFELQKLLMEK